LLDVSDIYRPVALITLGVPDETPGAKDRKSLEDIVSWEKYGK
jgi:nitroreductase